MFLLIDNYDSFTFNLVQAFQTLGLTPTVVRNDDPALPGLARSNKLSGVCLSPGPGRPDEAGLCLAVLQRLPKHVPVLGVCLGHQILGLHAGAAVGVGPRIAHGVASNISHNGENLFKNMPAPMRVGRYHSLLVDPAGCEDTVEVTARTEEGEVMGIRYKNKPWYGVQFHPESVLTPDGLRLLANFAGMLQGAGASPDDQAAAEPGPIGETAPTPPRFATIMDALAKGDDLTEEQARSAFNRLMDGDLSPAQAGALLMGLRAKGETPQEMVAAVNAILERAVPVAVPEYAPVLDVVGTGGDGKNSFNCSTGTAITLAGMGHQVLKHGNRSVSSRCGSADVLEGLGVPLDLATEEIPERLQKDGFVFLFAPRFHPSFRHIMPVRRELGVRTLFNLMGPLVNPARPGVCFLGVPREDILPLLAETLARMGNRTGAIVCGAGGYDELTTLGPAKVAYVRGGQVRFDTLDPAQYGFTPCREEDLAITGPEQGVAVLRELLGGKGPDAMRQMLALNTGFGLHLLHPEKTLAACMADAKNAIARGVGGAYLDRLLARARTVAQDTAA